MHWLSALALVVTLLTAGSLLVTSLRLGISPVPTSAPVRAAMLSLLPPSTVGEIHELGAGWGGLALALARHCPEATVVAWEASWVPCLVTWLRVRLSGLRNLRVKRADFRKGDFSKANVLVCYLFTGAMQWLDQALRRKNAGRELTILTNTFGLRGWPENCSVTVKDLFRTRVIRYTRVPFA